MISSAEHLTAKTLSFANAMTLDGAPINMTTFGMTAGTEIASHSHRTATKSRHRLCGC